MLTRFARAFIHSPGSSPGVTSPRAAASRSETVPRRADRAANPTSTGGAQVAGGTGTRKVGRPGITTTITSPKKKDRRSLDEKHADQQRTRDREQEEEEAELDATASTSRFAHWGHLAPAAAATAPARTALLPRDIPAGHGMRQAAIRAELGRLNRPASAEAEGKKTADQTIATAKRLGIIT